jgi:hypothetical protein
MTSLISRLATVLLLAVSMAAFSQDGFPGGEASRSVLKAQEKADLYFAKSKFDKAMSIYRDDLAPVGDKYSQYMIGYMYLAGKGVQEDAIMASAWYRLAAQRENAQYVRICDGLLALFNDEQLSRSDQLYVGLRQDMGDLTLVHKMIQNDMQILRRRTGSELFLQAEIERGDRRFERDEFDAAVSRMVSRIEYLERQMAVEKTLEKSEKEVLTKLLDEAEKEVDAYNVSR